MCKMLHVACIYSPIHTIVSGCKKKGSTQATGGCLATATACVYFSVTVVMLID